MQTVECKVILLHGTVIIFRAVTEGQGPGISPSYYEHDPQLFSWEAKENETTRTYWLLSSPPY